MLPLATSRAKSSHQAIFWSNTGQLAVRRGKWKLVQDGREYDGNSNDPLKGDDALRKPKAFRAKNPTPNREKRTASA